MTRGRPRRLSNHLIVDRYINIDLFKQRQEIMPSGCINWTGITNNAGYGFVGFILAEPPEGQRANGMMTVHRLAFMLANKRLPTTRNVNHTCHNRLCVNPDHLVEGTQQEKMHAMMVDGVKTGGRTVGSTGYAYNHKQNREYKFSEEEIQWMRSAQAEEIMTRHNLTRDQAIRKQWAFRRGYRWLPAPCSYPRLKPGRKPGVAK